MLQTPVGPSTEMSGRATVITPSTSPRDIVVGMETTVFVQCIVRPYTRPTQQSVSTPSSLLVSSEKPVPSVSGKENAIEMPIITVDTPVNMVVSDDAPVTPVDDKSDDGMIVIKGMTSFEEAEGVKKRWFRDDMRQSPVSPLLSE